MGYVGLTLAIALGSQGYKIIGIENNPKTLKHLLAGNPDVYEPYLLEIYKNLLSRGIIEIKEKIPQPCSATVFIITVGTPLDRNGNSNMSGISKVAEDIAMSLKPEDLIILRSTVKIGTTRDVVKPILGQKAIPYYLAMCPERTVEGKAITELLELPQIVGGVDSDSTREASDFFESFGVPVVRTSSSEASELAKLVCNVQRDIYYAVSNEVAILSEELGINACEVIKAANDNYPRCNLALPGLVAGPCLEKDVFILAESMKENKPVLALAARKLHNDLVPRAVQAVVDQVRHMNMEVKKIAVLGLAFKGSPPTGDIRGSLAIALKDELKKVFRDAMIVGYDPVATIEEGGKWGFEAVGSLDSALDGAELVFIQNNHKLFKGLQFADKLEKSPSVKIVYDFWNNLPRRMNKDFTYMTLGRSHTECA